MKFISSLGLVFAAATACIAAPTKYTEMAPSERALVDATNLICGQYPERDWVLIGTLRVKCNHVKAGGDEEVTVDKNWYVEYKIAE
ncbi:hypothetical protein M433DRAFT_8054 [Acidomyces richmondensis BFW]|nr:MAG: hypothetical protein FE78DRAFT_29333 [Acidomyces sp. 'richmondensis']KYG41305.1 hypothetical protein M433DRAFT_8054 [Acidomyces richmondensis BFW]